MRLLESKRAARHVLILPLKNHKVITMLTVKKTSDFNFSEMSNRANFDVAIGDYHGTVDVFKNRDGDVEIRKTDSIKNLEQAVQLDWSSIIEEYEAALPKIEEMREEKRIKERNKKYDASWAFTEKGELPEDHAASIEVEPREKFVKRGSSEPSVYIKYKNKRIAVDYTNVGRYNYNANMKFQISGSLTDYKARNYASLKNAADKVVKLVEKEERDEKRAEEAKQERKEKIAATLEELRSLFGEVDHEKRWRSSRNSRTGGGYYTDEYYVLQDDKKHSISKKYNKEGLYNFAGFSDLSADQVKGILDIIKVN